MEYREGKNEKQIKKAFAVILEMPHIDGMELAGYIKKYLPEVFIVFITSHTKYAIDAFELSIFRYVPKSTLQMKLDHAVLDAVKLINGRSDQVYHIHMPSRVEKIPYEKILYMTREGKNTIIVLADGSRTHVRKNLATVVKELNSDEFALDLRTVEMTELTRDILIGWIPLLEERQVEYTARIPEQPLWVKLDPDGYMRILNNLLQNVLAHSHADQIQIALSKQGDAIRLSLADNGVGLDPEDLEHIFERLYKCDKGRSKKGSGLGLSIVRQLTEKMGGKISAESQKGRGTVFTLLFPL